MPIGNCCAFARATTIKDIKSDLNAKLFIKPPLE
jgi:hypothetical protein